MQRLSFLTFVIIGLSHFVSKGDDSWLEHAVIYQIYPRSFKDSNNDGTGDLQGIISKLDFLTEAGINAIWLSPVYPSPMADAGYDISDFTDIHPDFGTLDDFDELVQKANASGIRIIMDLVPNHSSNEHEWFKLSENRTEGYENFYIWKNSSEDGGPPNNWISVFKLSAWDYSEIRGQWYLHQFAAEQPDLNFREPAVVQAMKDVLVFWMDRGVAGFRVDAISHMFEDENYPDEPFADGYTEYDLYNYNCLDHIYSTNQIETYYMVNDWRVLMDNYSSIHGRDKMIMMTEQWTNSNYTMMFYGNATHEGATFPFNFRFITDVSSSSTASNVAAVITGWLEEMPEGRVPNWVLGNHDQPRAATRFGTDRVDGYNMLAVLLPGVVLTYNGEEIGMENGEVTWEQGQDPQGCNGYEEDFDSNSRDFERTPYHWDNTTNAGFNEGAETWLPVSVKYLNCNLADQRYPADKRSHYHIYKSLVSLRNNEPFVSGSIRVAAVSDNVVAYTRELEGNDTYVVVFNLAEDHTTLDLTGSFSNLQSTAEVVIASVDSSKNEGDSVSTTSLHLHSFESLVLRNIISTSSATSTILTLGLLMGSILTIVLFK